jgi:tRNA(Ile)-lysidine synthase
MCLAHLFLEAVGKDGFAVAHCNFGLRGSESDGDEALVREWAERHSVKFHVEHFDTESFALSEGISIEMAARQLRYEWFAALCCEFGYNVLAVAHNANDNAETLMLNLLRGTGLNGLSCMSECSPLPFGEASDVILYRPLLEFTRKQIEGYAMTERIAFRHDSTNFSSQYRRNRLRNDVFPFFEKINPSFVRTLNREIGYFAEAGDIVQEWCSAQMPEVVEINDGTTCVSLRALMARKQWRYLLYYILEPFGFNSQTLASIEALLQSDRTISGKRFESLSHTLLVERESLIVLSRESAGLTEDICMPVRGTGIYNFNGARWQVEVLDWSDDMPLKQPQGIMIADADKLLFPFVCRRWRQGDWFIPLGMRGKKKVSDLYADLKYGALEKEASVMMIDTRSEGLAEDQHIAGVLGVRLDDSYKVTSSTKRIIRITILNNTETL